MRWERGAALAVLAVMTLGSPARASAPPENGPKARLAAIMAVHERARQRYHAEMEGRTTAEAQQPVIDRFLTEVHANANAALELVRANPEDPVVVDALRFVIHTARGGPGDESRQAMEILARGHERDPGMGELCSQVFYFFQLPVAESLIRSVLERHLNRDDRGLACHALATYLRHQSRMARRLRETPETVKDYEATRGKKAVARFLREKDPDALDLQAEALLERVVAEFGDVRYPLEKRTLGELAAGELFAMRNLAVGKAAPDIEGTDHEGKRFKLSDHLGEVVALTFSGNWCGPCVGMYPQERALQAKFKRRPFALVSVNTDKDLDTLKTSITSGKVTWRCWWDGGTEGPITTRWGVSSFPTVFVLDRKGVIRFRDVRGKALDEAVGALLE